MLPSVPAKGINKYLQDQIPEYDLRKNWFHPKSGIPWNKFFSATGKPIGTMADRTWLSDIVFMRMAEIYLTLPKLPLAMVMMPLQRPSC